MTQAPAGKVYRQSDIGHLSHISSGQWLSWPMASPPCPGQCGGGWGSGWSCSQWLASWGQRRTSSWWWSCDSCICWRQEPSGRNWRRGSWGWTWCRCCCTMELCNLVHKLQLHNLEDHHLSSPQTLSHMFPHHILGKFLFCSETFQIAHPSLWHMTWNFGEKYLWTRYLLYRYANVV